MKRKGVDPNVRTYTSAIIACKGDVETVTRLLDEMKAEGVSPDEATHRAAEATYSAAARSCWTSSEPQVFWSPVNVFCVLPSPTSESVGSVQVHFPKGSEQLYS